MLTNFERQVAEDRLEGWELVEFLQIPIEWVLNACEDNDWINEDNIEDVRELIGVKR